MNLKNCVLLINVTGGSKFLVMIKLIMTTFRTTLRILDVNLPVGPHKLIGISN